MAGRSVRWFHPHVTFDHFIYEDETIHPRYSLSFSLPLPLPLLGSEILSNGEVGKGREGKGSVYHRDCLRNPWSPLG